MLLFPFKFLFYFTLSYVILNIPIGNKTVFSHLNRATSPYSNLVFESIKDTGIKGYKSGISFTKTLFENASPKIADQVKEQASSTTEAIHKKLIDSRSESTLEGSYTDQEKELLKSILESGE